VKTARTSKRTTLVALAIATLVMTTAFSCGEAGPPVHVENGSGQSVVKILACRMVGAEASAKTLIENKEGVRATFHVQMTFRSPANNLLVTDDKNVTVGANATNYLGFGHVFKQDDKELRCTVSRFSVVRLNA